MSKADPRVNPFKQIAHQFQGTVLAGLLGAIVILTCVPASPAAGQDTPTKQMSDTVEILCPKLAAINQETPLPPSQKDLLDRCSEVKIRTDAGETFEDLTTDQVSGLSNMSSDETSTMKTLTVETAQTQFAAVIGRLEALRGGAPGNLALNFRRPDAEPVLYAGPVTLAASGDAGVQAIGDTGNLGVFLNGYWGTGGKDVTTFEPGFNYDGWDVTGGVDYRFTPNFILGAAVGYSTLDADMDSDAGDIESDGMMFSLYGLYYWDAFYVNAVGSLGSRDYDTVRNIRYTVDLPVDQSFSGDTDADDYGLNLGAGYDFFTEGFTYGPYAQLRYFKSEIDGYSESLIGTNTDPGYGLALAIDDQTVKSFTSTLGGQVSYARTTGFGILQPYLRLGWVHEFENDERTITGGFINVPDDPEVVPLNDILISTDEPDRDYFDLGLGISAVFPGGMQAFLNYQTLLGMDDISSHLLAGGVRFEF